MPYGPLMLNCGLSMHRECRERFPRHRLQRKPLVSDPGMHHNTCAPHVPGCLSGSLSRGAGKSFHGILGACATRNFTCLARGQWNAPNISREAVVNWVPLLFPQMHNTSQNYTQGSNSSLFVAAWIPSYYGQRGPYSPHKLCNLSIYIEIIIFPQR